MAGSGLDPNLFASLARAYSGGMNAPGGSEYVGHLARVDGTGFNVEYVPFNQDVLTWTGAPNYVIQRKASGDGVEARPMPVYDIQVAPGSGQVGIQAALDAAPSTGANIYIPPGTWNIPNCLYVDGKSRIVLIGAGRDRTILNWTESWTARDASAVRTARGTHGMIMVGGSGVGRAGIVEGFELRDITLRDVWGPSSADNAAADFFAAYTGLPLMGNSGSLDSHAARVLAIDNVDDTALIDAGINGCISFGAHITANPYYLVNRLRVQGCRFSRPAAWAGLTTSLYMLNPNCELMQCDVSNNEVEMVAAWLQATGYNVAVHDNKLYRVSFTGIYVGEDNGPTASLRGCSVARNIFTELGWNAGAQYARGITVQIEDIQADGTASNGVVVEGNVFSETDTGGGSGVHAIEVGTGNATTRGNIAGGRKQGITHNGTNKIFLSLGGVNPSTTHAYTQVISGNICDPGQNPAAFETGVLDWGDDHKTVEFDGTNRFLQTSSQYSYQHASNGAGQHSTVRFGGDRMTGKIATVHYDGTDARRWNSAGQLSANQLYGTPIDATVGDAGRAICTVPNFDPDAVITALAAGGYWWDARRPPVVSGTGVCTGPWLDRISGLNVGVAGTPQLIVNEPALNDHPVIEFNGTTAYFQAASGGFAIEPMTMILVFKPTSTPAHDEIVAAVGTGASGTSIIRYASTAGMWGTNDGVGGSMKSNRVLAPNAGAAVALIRPTSASVILRTNGVESKSYAYGGDNAIVSSIGGNAAAPSNTSASRIAHVIYLRQPINDDRMYDLSRAIQMLCGVRL